MSFIRLKVSTRIYLGFGVLVALGLGVAGFGVYQFLKVEDQVVKMTALSANLEQVLDVTHDTETIRRTETSLSAGPQ